jgi:hypothetical protein
VIVGHGLRERTMEGPVTADAPPALTGVMTRRYRCRSCEAVLVVLPPEVTRGYRYTLSAIAWALSLWGYARATAAQTRARTSTQTKLGACSAGRWASLSRWTRRASSLFGIAPGKSGTLRDRAAKVAAFIAAHSPVSTGRVPQDAFLGAWFCGSG